MLSETGGPGELLDVSYNIRGESRRMGGGEKNIETTQWTIKKRRLNRDNSISDQPGRASRRGWVEDGRRNRQGKISGVPISGKRSRHAGIIGGT